MSDARRIVEETWQLLAHERVRDGHLSRELADFKTMHGHVLLASDGDGTRHVLVPISANEVVLPDQSSRGVHLLRSVLVDNGVTRTFLDIRCVDASLQRVFCQVAAALLDAIASSPDTPSSTARQVLAEWRGLLRQAHQEVTASSLRATFGELSELLTLARIAPSALDCWRGPESAPQDFISPAGALEVKATAYAPPKSISIHGIAQLDAAGVPLVLSVLAVLTGPSGKSLGELVEQLVALHVDREKLLDKLARIGIHDLGKDLVARTKFSVHDAMYFAVRDAFPRLTASELVRPLHPAVANVNYGLDVTQLGDFRISESEVDAHRRAMLS